MPTPDYSSPPKWALPILGRAVMGLVIGSALGWGTHRGWLAFDARHPDVKTEVVRFLRREPAPPQPGASVAEGSEPSGSTKPVVAIRSNVPISGATSTNSGATVSAPVPVAPAPMNLAPVPPAPAPENRFTISWLTLGEPEVGSWVTNLVSIVNSGPAVAGQLSAEVKVLDSRVVAQATSGRPVLPGAAFTFPVVWKVVSPGASCFGVKVDAGPGGITNFNHCLEAVLPKLELEWQPGSRPVFGLFTTNVLRIESRSRGALENVVVVAGISGNGEVAPGGGTQFVIQSLAPGAAIQLGFVSTLKANTPEGMSVTAEASWNGRSLGRARQDVLPWLPNIQAAFAGAVSGKPAGVMTVYASLTNLGTESVRRLSVELETGGRRVSARSRGAGTVLDLTSVGPGEHREFQFQLPQPAADLPARLVLVDELGWKKIMEVLIRNTPPAPADPGRFPAVEYPLEARKNREEGTVRIEAEVMSTGWPLSVRVLESSGSITLDRATVQHVKKHWRWPAGVARTERTSVSFQLEP